MDAVDITVRLAEPRPGCHKPSRFSVRLVGPERDVLYQIRAALIEAGESVNGRPADTATGRDMVRWLLRRVAGMNEKPVPTPTAERVAVAGNADEPERA